MSEDEQLVSGAAAEVLEHVFGRAPERASQFHKSLVELDSTQKFLQREVWKRFKLVGIHPDEDSELVQRTTRLVRAGEFSIPAPEGGAGGGA